MNIIELMLERKRLKANEHHDLKGDIHFEV